MAKQQTRKELQETIEKMFFQMDEMKKQLEIKDKTIAEKDGRIAAEQTHAQNLLNKVGLMLRGDQEMIVVGNQFGSIQEPKMTLSAIAFNIGELKLIQREYYDLKDRCLPVPKMQVLEDDRNNQKK